MKILGLIPARGGSKGVPKKNIKLLGNKPLIAYTIESAKKSTLLSQTIVSTDDDEIFTVAELYGLKPPFLRPADYAQDTSTSVVVVQHAIAYFESEGIFFDAVCLLQPTTPFRAKGFIDAAVQKFIDSGADSLVSVLPVPSEYNPHWVFERGADGLLKIATGETKVIPRRQELPDAYHRDGALYITKTETVKNGSLLGETIAFYENSSELYVNIDTADDWKKAEKMVDNPNILSQIGS